MHELLILALTIATAIGYVEIKVLKKEVKMERKHNEDMHNHIIDIIAKIKKERG